MVTGKKYKRCHIAKKENKMKFRYGVLGLGLLAGFLAACAPQGGITLKVYNWGGYIYEKDASILDDQDLVEQFSDWYFETYGVNVKVEYTTYGTNEEMYTQVVELNRDYDIFAPSDYMIQRLMKEGWLSPFDKVADVRPYLSNYDAFVSPYLQSIYEALEVQGVTGTVADYAAGYMWGTVGLVYNPDKVTTSDMTSWQALYDEKYKDKATIKDSVREVLMAAIMDVYQDEFLAKRAEYLNNTITGSAYNIWITNKINTINDSVLAAVEPSLLALVENAYGLETDNAKNDIVANKIDMFMAWSGDATFAMDTADEEDGVPLEYIIPNEGSNIWFDGFVMHKDIAKDDTGLPENQQVKVIAQRFIDYVSQPEIAIQNMGYIGYTSFIAGDEVLQSVIDLNDEYNDGVDANDLLSLDLGYFFDDTTEKLDATDMVIQVQPNRQIMTQYPSEATITRTALFKDFGSYNETIASMWSRVKASANLGGGNDWFIPAVIGVAILAGTVYFISQNNKKNRRPKRS
jgi:spermidine/putrescine transport system substrate-binding protein